MKHIFKSSNNSVCPHRQAPVTTATIKATKPFALYHLKFESWLIAKSIIDSVTVLSYQNESIFFLPLLVKKSRRVYALGTSRSNTCTARYHVHCAVSRALIELIGEPLRGLATSVAESPPSCSRSPGRRNTARYSLPCCSVFARCGLANTEIGRVTLTNYKRGYSNIIGYKS